jgi:hypothetical protein
MCSLLLLRPPHLHRANANVSSCPPGLSLLLSILLIVIATIVIIVIVMKEGQGGGRSTRSGGSSRGGGGGGGGGGGFRGLGGLGHRHGGGVDMWDIYWFSRMTEVRCFSSI